MKYDPVRDVQPGKWIVRNGSVLNYFEMDDSHLANAIHFVEVWLEANRNNPGARFSSAYPRKWQKEILQLKVKEMKKELENRRKAAPKVSPFLLDPFDYPR